MTTQQTQQTFADLASTIALPEGYKWKVEPGKNYVGVEFNGDSDGWIMCSGYFNIQLFYLGEKQAIRCVGAYDSVEIAMYKVARMLFLAVELVNIYSSGKSVS
jgi:hypothetical protein